MFDPIDYALHYGGMCRECADAAGVCPTSGMPCNPSEARRAAEHCLKAWSYGIENGFMSNPFAGLSAHRVISDEMRHAACKALNDRDRGNAVTIVDVNAMLVAALGVAPSPQPKLEVTDAAVFALAEVLIGMVNAPENVIYRAARKGLEAALQAAPAPVQHVEGSEAEKIALLEERISSLEDELDEARQVPWPEWSTSILKLVRSYSGYDGYDDATEGVDLVAEVEEALSELQSGARKSEGVAIEALRKIEAAALGGYLTPDLCAQIVTAALAAEGPAE